MNKISISLIQNDRLLREGLAGLINNEPDFEIVTAAGASNGDNLLPSLTGTLPSVVLLDMEVIAERGLRVIDTLRRAAPDAQIILMGLVEHETNPVDFVRAGVSGFLLKESTPDDLRQTIRTVNRGGKVLPSPLIMSLFARLFGEADQQASPAAAEWARLTRREHEVVELIAQGLSNKEIAQRLNLATHTVKSHVHNIFEKLQLHTRLQLASRANARRTCEAGGRHPPAPPAPRNGTVGPVDDPLPASLSRAAGVDSLGRSRPSFSHSMDGGRRNSSASLRRFGPGPGAGGGRIRGRRGKSRES